MSGGLREHGPAFSAGMQFTGGSPRVVVRHAPLYRKMMRICGPAGSRGIKAAGDGGSHVTRGGRLPAVREAKNRYTAILCRQSPYRGVPSGLEGTTRASICLVSNGDQASILREHPYTHTPINSSAGLYTVSGFVDIGVERIFGRL